MAEHSEQPTSRLSKYLRRAPVLALVAGGCLALLPGAWSMGQGGSGPRITAGYAPVHLKNFTPSPQSDASDLEVVLVNQWQFTADTVGPSPPSGIKIRR